MRMKVLTPEYYLKIRKPKFRIGDICVITGSLDHPMYDKGIGHNVIIRMVSPCYDGVGYKNIHTFWYDIIMDEVEESIKHQFMEHMDKTQSYTKMMGASEDTLSFVCRF